jgi:hypothetical protein
VFCVADDADDLPGSCNGGVGDAEGVADCVTVWDSSRLSGGVSADIKKAAGKAKGRTPLREFAPSVRFLEAPVIGSRLQLLVTSKLLGTYEHDPHFPNPFRCAFRCKSYPVHLPVFSSLNPG